MTSDRDVADGIMAYCCKQFDPDDRRQCPGLRDAIEAALASVREEEREACADVGIAYAAEMAEAIERQKRRKKPTIVAECKEDAGLTIVSRIRSRQTPTGTGESPAPKGDADV